MSPSSTPSSAGLTAVDVEFLIEAQGQTTTDQALLAEAALNEEWERCDCDIERNAAIKDALIVGIGFVKVAYDFFATTAMQDRDYDGYQQEVQDLIEQAKQAGYKRTGPPGHRAVGPRPGRGPGDSPRPHRRGLHPVGGDSLGPDREAVGRLRWVAQLTKLTLDEVRENPLWREYVKRPARPVACASWTT